MKHRKVKRCLFLWHFFFGDTTLNLPWLKRSSRSTKVSEFCFHFQRFSSLSSHALTFGTIKCVCLDLDLYFSTVWEAVCSSCPVSIFGHLHVRVARLCSRVSIRVCTLCLGCISTYVCVVPSVFWLVDVPCRHLFARLSVGDTGYFVYLSSQSPELPRNWGLDSSYIEISVHCGDYRIFFKRSFSIVFFLIDFIL